METGNKPTIVAHYHELWLKGRNRPFFVGKLIHAMHRALDGLAVERISKPGDRVLIELGNPSQLPEALARLKRVSGISYYGIARRVERTLDALAAEAWEEIAPEKFSTFAVRAKRSDKSFPHNVGIIERKVGGVLLERLRAEGRDVRVNLDSPELTLRIEITPGPALVYARRIPGPGGLPPNTAGRMLCLISGGFDSAVAAYKMMKRGAHVSFAHFYGAGARPGESSIHVARELVRRLVPWEFTAKLFLVPLEAIQRKIVLRAPEEFRVLLYRRMMARIAEKLARRDHAIALVTGDSLGQVASQTLANMVSVGAAVRMPIFRPLAGSDKQEILAIAREIGTHDISAEPFHDCCPVFLPRNPALHASAADLEEAEASLDVAGLVQMGLGEMRCERYEFVKGHVEQLELRKELNSV
jgi:thiamine biosynthesis protein ThiI